MATEPKYNRKYLHRNVLFPMLMICFLTSCKMTQQVATSNLLKASLFDRPQLVKKYIRKGGFVDYREPKRGWTPLLFASEGGFLEVAEILLLNGANPNITSHKDEVFPLQRAASNGHFKLVELLLDNGANVNAYDGLYRTSALMYASLNGHVDVVELLIRKGAFIDARGSRGETALFIAVSAEKEHVVEVLLKNGADKKWPNTYGQTCLKEAQVLNNQNIINLLNRY